MRKRKYSRNNIFQVSSKKDSEFLVEQYRVLSADRISHNQLFWNVQLMFLTAQAFLLILALGGFTPVYWAKTIGAFVGFIFSFLSIQGFERNRLMEISDAELLLDIERYFINKGFRGLEVHDKPNKQRYLNNDYVNQHLCTMGIDNIFCRSISYDLWKSGLWLILFINVILFFYNTLIFSFVYTSGKFLLYDSFKAFRTSFDNTAIGTIVVILVINWVLYMFGMIKSQQPRFFPKHHLPSEKTLYYKIPCKMKIYIYSFESLLILGAVLYSAFAYFKHTVFYKYTWLILFVFCCVLSIIPIIFCDKKHKKKH